MERRGLSLIIIVFIMFMHSNICFAYDEFDEIMKCAKTAQPISAIKDTISSNGIVISPKKIFFGAYFDHGFPKNQILGTKIRAACIIGFEMVFKNTSDKVAIINWNKSAVCIDGRSLGAPFMDGMKYIDVGKSDIIANDIIPPNCSITRGVYVPAVRFREGDFSFSSQWVIDGAILFKGKTRKFDFYIASEIYEYNKEYIHVDIPPITTPTTNDKK